MKWLKLLGKVNLVGALLGLIIYWFLFYGLNLYDLSRSSKILVGRLDLLLFVFTTIILPILVSKFLSRSKLALLLPILWIPYVFMWGYIDYNFIPHIPKNVPDDYGRGLLSLFIILGYPIYIFCLSVIGIFVTVKE